MANENLETVIEDSINDAASPDPEPVESTDSTDTAVDAAAAETTEVAADTSAESSQAPAPGAADPGNDEVADEFGKRFGIQGQSITGRENRIPYSRVKKIVERAEKEAADKARKEFEGTSQPKVTEYETKIKDYEGRLQKVAEFEQLIEYRPQEFLNFLSGLPAYKEFFDYINKLAAQPQQAQATPAQEAYLDPSTMPQPDETLADGSKVYSLAGLAKRDEWLAKQVEARAIKAAEDKIAKRYEPIEQQWQAEQRRQQAIPLIQKQIAEARTWPHFADHEAEIIEVLKADQNITLDGAYRKVLTEKVLPKLQQDREAQRRDILDELKKKPIATAAPTNPIKPAKTPAGPRSLEDVISEAVQSLK